VTEQENRTEHAKWLDHIADQMNQDYADIRREVEQRGPASVQEAGHRAEATWKTFLQNWLPPHYEVGTRKYIVADAATGGAKSSETDLVVFHPSYPRQLRERSTVLASGVVAAFSVKLTLDGKGLTEAINAAQQLRRLLPSRPAHTVRDQLFSPIMCGILTHSHAWKAENSKPTESIEMRLSTQAASNPRNQLDVVCVADLAGWFRAVFVVTEQMITDLKQAGISDRPHVQDVMFREHSPDAQALGGLIYALLRRLSLFDPTIRPIADGIQRVATGSRRGDVRTRWPLDEALSPETLAGIRRGLWGLPDWELKYA
jgi:hypothetical protein